MIYYTIHSNHFISREVVHFYPHQEAGNLCLAVVSQWN